jgi:hypothetical protein
MDDDLRAIPRSETKYGDMVSRSDNDVRWQCAHCDETSTSREDHIEHMSEVHNL